MTVLWEKFNSLNTFIVPYPSMKPFLWNETIMFLLPKIGWWVDESSILTIVSSRSMKNCSCFMDFIITICRLFLLCFLKSLFSQFFVPLHKLFLILIQICFLSFKLLHAFINGPRSLKISARRIPCFLSCPFQLFSICFSAFSSCTFNIGFHVKFIYSV